MCQLFPCRHNRCPHRNDRGKCARYLCLTREHIVEKWPPSVDVSQNLRGSFHQGTKRLSWNVVRPSPMEMLTSFSLLHAETWYSFVKWHQIAFHLNCQNSWLSHSSIGRSRISYLVQIVGDSCSVNFFDLPDVQFFSKKSYFSTFEARNCARNSGFKNTSWQLSSTGAPQKVFLNNYAWHECLSNEHVIPKDNSSFQL